MQRKEVSWQLFVQIQANRQLQKEFNESGNYRDTRHDKSIRKSNDPKFMGSTETVGGIKSIYHTI